ncbi:MAG: phosphate/phosphite/phosphonate ABC transporter substrate-binding protein [Gammaproteobacteria bacterium]
MTAPPREKSAAGKTLYAPLAAAIGKILGVNVVYKHPGNWLRYQRNMRNGEYDIVFDGPHFASWRIEHLGHKVLVKLPGTLVFYLVTNKADDEVLRPEDLIGKKICGISPPNLSTLSVLARFDNPVRQPVILGIRGGMGKVLKKFTTGSCRAAVFRNTFYKKKIPKAERDRMRILFESEALPNQVITVSSRISKSQRDKLAKAIIFGSASKAAKGIVKRFGGKAKSFVTAKTEEYLDARILLEGVIFGW